MKNWNKNVVITAWEVNDDFTTEGGQTFSRAYPQIRKPILGNVMGLALQVGRLTISQKSGKRGVILSPSSSIFAKNQIDKREFALPEDLFKDGDPQQSPTTKKEPKAPQSKVKDDGKVF